MGKFASLQNLATRIADLDYSDSSPVANGNSPSFEIETGHLAQPALNSGHAKLIPLSSIVVSNRIRQYLDPSKTESLACSIRQHGFRGVLWVRLINGKYHLIAGGRRFAACQLAGVSEVPIEVLEVTDAEAIQLELLENFQREDLNPIEEVEGVLRMLEVTLGVEQAEVISLLGRMSRRGKDTGVLTAETAVEADLYQQIEQVFQLIGKYSPESFRTHRLPLLNLPESLVTAINGGELEYSKARVIARIKDEQIRKQVLEQVLSEGLSRSEVSELVKQTQTESQPPAALPERRVYSKAQDITKRLRAAKLADSKLKKLEKLLEQIDKLLNEA